MSTNLTTISNILKDQYLPALKNQITTAPSPFMEMIKKVPLTTGGKITAVAPFGINGGFGFGSDGTGVPSSGPRSYKRFEVEPVDMYVDIRISDKTAKLAGNAGALISALDDEVIGSYEAARWNVSRALFGDGSGRLCGLTGEITISETDKTATVPVDSTAALIEGLTVDLFYYSSVAAASGNLIEGNKGLRILSIDRENKIVTLDSAADVAAIPNSLDNNLYGFLCVQGSYNKELTGLKTIFDSSVPTLYGYEKAKNPSIVPLTVDAGHALTDTVVYDAVKKAMDYRNSRINLVMMGDKAFRAYQAYMRTNNHTVCEKAEFVGGATGYKVMVGSQTVTVVNEKLVPESEAWCVDTDAFSFVYLDFDFCDFGSTGIFRLEPGTSYYRALLASYGNLICKNPGGCVKITNCSEA